MYSTNDKPFICTNGQQISSINQLYISLKTMPKDVFLFHTAQSGNHFASWVKDVFSQPALAEELNNAHTQIGTLGVLEKFLIQEQRKLEEEQAKFPKGVKETQQTKTVAPVKTEPVQQNTESLAKTESDVTENQDDSTFISQDHKKIHHHIKKLHGELAHLTKHKTHMPTHHPHNAQPVTESVKDKLVDFGFGLIIGIVLGLIIAKSSGFF